MTTTTTTTTTGRAGVRLRFDRILAAEFTKFFTLASTWSTLGTVVVLTVGIAWLTVMGMPTAADAADWGMDVGAAASIVGTASVAGVFAAQLVAAVFGVLAVSSEYRSGQIRSTLTAVPRRWSLVAAKALGTAIVIAVTGLVAFVIARVLVVGVASGKGWSIDLVDGAGLAQVLWADVYLVAVALLGVGVGAIVRSTAAGISIVLGLLLVLPILLSVINAEWAAELAKYTVSAVGLGLAGLTFIGVSADVSDGIRIVTLALWVAVPLAAGGVLLARRDA